jgi:hypothetical protein
MFTDWNGRKRGREDEVDDNDHGASGFSEHRTVRLSDSIYYNSDINPSQKRRIASLPHRQSPKLNRHTTPPTFTFGTGYPAQPAPPTITPADSESEDTPTTTEPKSFFSPYSSSPGGTLIPSDPPSPYLESLESSQPTQMSDAPIYADDFEMEDTAHFSPAHSQTQHSPSISGRIPTPIHSSFAPFIRAEKASLHHDVDFADDEALVDRFRRGRRLPSPISEGEMSPSVIVDGLGDMQMEVDKSSSQHEQERLETPTKKGHQRSKHSLRQWSGFGGDMSSAGVGMKRSFSMGYRSDCEKCRMKVPGHFSHIITY